MARAAPQPPQPSTAGTRSSRAPAGPRVSGIGGAAAAITRVRGFSAGGQSIFRHRYCQVQQSATEWSPSTCAPCGGMPSSSPLSCNIWGLAPPLTSRRWATEYRHWRRCRWLSSGSRRDREKRKTEFRAVTPNGHGQNRIARARSLAKEIRWCGAARWVPLYRPSIWIDR